MQAQNFRIYLQETLVQRTSKNSNYSLRAFAKSLDISSSELSKLLKEKRNISDKMFNKLSANLSLAPNEIEKYRPRKLATNQALQKNDLDYKQLTLDVFQSIADWYHDAILELTRVKAFKPIPKWIASTLGITVNETNIAIERLKRIELLEIEENGTWTSNDTSIVANEYTAIALKKLQMKILDKAQIAVQEVPIERRDQTSMTMAIDSEDLAEAKIMITKFRRELNAFLQRKGKVPNDVYQLSISLFPLTNIKNLGDKNEI